MQPVHICIRGKNDFVIAKIADRLFNIKGLHHTVHFLIFIEER